MSWCNLCSACLCVLARYVRARDVFCDGSTKEQLFREAKDDSTKEDFIAKLEAVICESPLSHLLVGGNLAAVYDEALQAVEKPGNEAEHEWHLTETVFSQMITIFVSNRLQEGTKVMSLFQEMMNTMIKSARSNPDQLIECKWVLGTKAFGSTECLLGNHLELEFRTNAAAENVFQQLDRLGVTVYKAIVATFNTKSVTDGGHSFGMGGFDKGVH